VAVPLRVHLCLGGGPGARWLIIVQASLKGRRHHAALSFDISTVLAIFG
jgi:hypothetical protein